MRTRSGRLGVVALALLAGALTGCDGPATEPSDAGAGRAATADPAPEADRSPATRESPDAPTDEPSAAVTPGADPSAGPAPADGPTPGQPCEPGSHPDCSDATGSEGDPYRIIAGYADCVARFGPEHAYGLCTDLDGDDHAGYDDAG